MAGSAGVRVAVRGRPAPRRDRSRGVRGGRGRIQGLASNELLKQGEQPALRKMANDIIAAQTKEIAQMRARRKAWYGSAGTSDNATYGSDDSMGMGGG